MGGYLILEFSSESEAGMALQAINLIAANWWDTQGFTVIENDSVKELVGRNAASGQDRPDACRTTTWATILQSPDQTYYFSSLSNDDRFQNWREYMPDGVSTGTEKEFPDTWQIEY